MFFVDVQACTRTCCDYARVARSGSVPRHAMPCEAHPTRTYCSGSSGQFGPCACRVRCTVQCTPNTSSARVRERVSASMSDTSVRWAAGPCSSACTCTVHCTVYSTSQSFECTFESGETGRGEREQSRVGSRSGTPPARGGAAHDKL